jgi:tetratricopeptide (TPR) repeat protein
MGLIPGAIAAGPVQQQDAAVDQGAAATTAVAAAETSVQDDAAVAEVAEDEAAEDEAAVETEWIPGGETSEGFSLKPIPLPDFSGLEDAVQRQLRAVAEDMTSFLTAGEAERNALGEAYGETGQVFHAYGFSAAAAPCYENAILMLPGDPRWPHLLGYLHQQAGDMKAARQRYQEALEASDDLLPTRLRLAEIDLQEDNLQAAQRTLQDILDQHPDYLAARAMMAEVDLALADFDKAIAGFEAVLAEAPGANRYHYSLALAYRDNRNMEKAKYHMSQRGEVGLSVGDTLVEGLEDRKQGERVFLLRGRRAFGAGRFDEAAEAFAEAVAAAPTSARSRVNLGSALAAADKIDEAVAQYRIVLELEPDNATAHYNLGHLLAKGDQPEDALPHLRFAVEADPKDTEAQMLMATVLRRVGQPDEALEIYRGLAELDPTSEVVRLRQAAALVDLRRYAEARTSLEEALAVMPQEGRLLVALARLLAASPDPQVRDGERALELARSIWQAASSAPHAELMASSYGELERCEEAAAWQQVAVDMALNDASQSAEQQAARQRTLAYYKQARPCRPPV